MQAHRVCAKNNWCWFFANSKIFG